ncbi:MAG: hypothetical protein ISS15_10275 [Alphaproteobacteria bacterium]|nr:hypothetical protein [Alphaproteobacteria bacterium]MBL7098035.1 hypothetical protein [Alphaproteobacteria bacterium]
MTKYDRLGAYLRGQGKDLIPMTFGEIERVVGTRLPKSQKHQAWWSNSTSNNVMTQVWLDAGYRTEQVDITLRKLVFRRVVSASGMHEQPSTFRNSEPAQPPAPPPGTNLARHPASGALKGMVTIEPGYDLTKPVYTDKEWEEVEKEIMADFDQINENARK